MKEQCREKRLLGKQNWYGKKTKLQASVKDANNTHHSGMLICVHVHTHTHTTTHPSAVGEAVNISMKYTNICTKWISAYIEIVVSFSLSGKSNQWKFIVSRFQENYFVLTESECGLQVEHCYVVNCSATSS